MSDRRTPVCVCLVLVACWSGLLSAQSSTPASQDQSLRDAIAAIITDHQGDVSVAVKHLQTGDHVLIDASRPMPTASLIKFPVLVATYLAAEKGELNLDQSVTLTEADKCRGLAC